MNPTEIVKALESRINELLTESKEENPNRIGLFREGYGIGYRVAMSQVLDTIRELTGQNTPPV